MAIIFLNCKEYNIIIYVVFFVKIDNFTIKKIVVSLNPVKIAAARLSNDR